jgi:hypothetical protein
MTSKPFDEKHLRMIWSVMKWRCLSGRIRSGSKIRVCVQWVNSFWAFRRWALSHGYANHRTLRRINTNDNYSPWNCRWVARRQQCVPPSTPTVQREDGSETVETFGEGETCQRK